MQLCGCGRGGQQQGQKQQWRTGNNVGSAPKVVVGLSGWGASKREGQRRSCRENNQPRSTRSTVPRHFQHVLLQSEPVWRKNAVQTVRIRREVSLFHPSLARGDKCYSPVGFSD